jgi:hypothetical protein
MANLQMAKSAKEIREIFQGHSYSARDEKKK